MLGSTVLSVLAMASLQGDGRILGARSLALSDDGTRIAFSYRGDVFVAPISGGRAVPITSNVEMDDNPVWSPDGTAIAFASNRNGNNDIYTVAAEGGQPKRLTWHSNSDVPSDWSPDGKKIVLRGNRDIAYNGIMEIDVATGAFRSLFSDQMTVNNPKYSPDGQQILYNRLGFPISRARYIGSAAAQLWAFNTADGKRTKIRDTQRQHLWPNWTQNGIYAITLTGTYPNSSPLGKPIPKQKFDAPKTPNVYQIDLRGGAKPITQFAEDGTRYLAAAKKANVVAFERDGDVYVSRNHGAPVKLEFFANLDEKFNTLERLVLTTGVSGFDTSPDGKSAVFSVRGELWSVPITKGKGPNKDDATQLTTWEGIDQEPIYSPDGKTVFFVSDRMGAAALHRLNVETGETALVSAANADVSEVKLTPDKRFVSYWATGASGGLYRAPVGGGQATLVFSRPGLETQNYEWSPDGKYFAFAEEVENSGMYYWEVGRNIHIVDTATGKAYDVTQLNMQSGSPTWSLDGKYLFYSSNRGGGGIYVLPLQPEELDADEVQMEYKKPTDPVSVSIDFTDIELRSRRLIPTTSTSRVIVDPENGNLYYENETDLWRAPFNGENPTRLTQGGGVSSIGFSQDGKNIHMLRQGNMFLVELRKNGTPQTKVDFRADWTRDILKERNAAYNQFYSTYNRAFYDGNFHGRDWSAICAKYRKFLPSVGHRNEMATILNFVIGEVEASHTEVSGAFGALPNVSSSNLGFEFDYGYTGKGIRVKSVPNRAPGSFSKSKLNAGDVVTKINGKAATISESLYRDVLNEQSGRELTLTVTDSAGKERTVVYRGLSGGEYSGIVNSNLLNWRRKYVEEKSGGKLTYAYIAGMNQGELDRFNQNIWQYSVGKKGAIIDVRGNGGGNTSDRIIDMLERRRNAFYVPRDRPAVGGPGTVLDVPLIVMCSQNSYSNAEMFPNAMRTRGLAKLVGMPTPGYVIYTNGFQLVDGTNCRLPHTGVYRLDGSNMENVGVVPDWVLELTPEDFFAGKDPQLDKAIEELMKQVK